jgi:putative membrane protein
MKLTLPVALTVSLTVAVSTFAADQARKPEKKTKGSLPSKSKMIVMPPATDPAVKGDGPSKLINSEMSGKDLQFFTSVVAAGRFQAYLVKLLETKAQSDQIQALGSALATTQDQENEQIARLAATKGWTVSTEPTAAEKAFGAQLEKQGGSNFDKAVMDKVIAAVQQSVSAYEEAVQSTDQDIKSFAEQMLPLAKAKLQFTEKMTGAGQAATQFFRTGAPPKPKVKGEGIIPAKPKPAPAPAAPSADSTAPPSSVPASPNPISPPITR